MLSLCPLQEHQTRTSKRCAKAEIKMNHPDSCPKRGDQIIAQKAASELLLLNMEDGNYYSLNEIGGRIWELCDGKRTVSQVVAALAVEYQAPYSTLENDVLELLDDFRRGNLIA
jgi:Coenzyme PQQ synthesis protein D (PqqD)